MAALVISVIAVIILFAIKSLPGPSPARTQEKKSALIQYLSEYATFSDSVLFLNRRSKSLRAVMRVRRFKNYQEIPGRARERGDEKAFLLFNEENVSCIKLTESVHEEAKSSSIERLISESGEILLVSPWSDCGTADSALSTYEKCVEILDWVCRLESEESH